MYLFVVLQQYLFVVIVLTRVSTCLQDKNQNWISFQLKNKLEFILVYFKCFVKKYLRHAGMFGNLPQSCTWRSNKCFFQYVSVEIEVEANSVWNRGLCCHSDLTVEFFQ